ncbi:hypothetical protein Goari_017375, partial [Gossypium aridum]|nr:hypothetical protein [Gossypium aridum]
MPDRWIQLCTDGAVQVDSRTTAAGSVLRHGNGEWIIGYNKFLCECFLDGLALIQDRRYTGVMIQMDNIEIVKAIQNSSSTVLNSTLIKQIHQLLANVGLWVLQYIPREINKITDSIAKMVFDTRQAQGARTFNVKYYGAVADGRSDNRK